MADVILFFPSNADTMIATKALKDAGVTAKMIPKPASVNSASNLCLSIDPGFEGQAVTALSGAKIALSGIAEIRLLLAGSSAKLLPQHPGIRQSDLPPFAFAFD